MLSAKAATKMVAAIAALWLWGCGNVGSESARLACKAGDKACAVKAMRDHVARKQAFWKDAFARPLAERIGPAPPELVEMLALDVIANAIPNQPRRITPQPDFTADVRSAFEELPAAVKRLFEARLAGIYFVEDFGGTGFTDHIDGPDGKRRTGYIVLDPAVLRSHTANSWATWRDGTPFKPHPAWKLEVTLEPGAEDNRKNAIQYILLHELGHVLSIGGDIHPDWAIAPKDVGPTTGFPYFQLSWSIPPGESRYATRFDATYAQRQSVVYYFGPKLGGDEMLAAYEGLERTNFATLYSVTHPGDDFAEAFANYVHTVLMGKPFEIRLYKDGQVAKRYPACWTEPRCALKRRMLEALLDVR